MRVHSEGLSEQVVLELRQVWEDNGKECSGRDKQVCGTLRREQIWHGEHCKECQGGGR